MEHNPASSILHFRACVTSGRRRGAALRKPTINLSLQDVPSTLAEGIYACRAILFFEDGSADGPFPAAMHFGPRPVFNDTVSCEVHLIDITPSSFLTCVEVEVVKRLRDVQDFPSVEALKEQMERDIEEARGILFIPSYFDASVSQRSHRATQPPAPPVA